MLRNAEPLRKLTKKNPIAVYDSICIVNEIAWALVIVNLILVIAKADTTGQKVGFSTFLAMAVMQLFLEIMEHRQRKKQMDYTSQDITTEIQKSAAILSKNRWVNQKYAHAKLNEFKGDPYHPFLLTFKHSKTLEISWEIGHATLYHQAMRMVKLQKELMKIPAWKNLLPEIPYEFTRLSRLLPYQDYIVDMPTKRRYGNYLGVTALIFTISIANLLKQLREDDSADLQNSCLPIFFSTLIFNFVATWIESQILLDARLKFNLDGFYSSYRFGNHLAPCIYMQLSQTCGIYPNRALTETTRYLINFLELLNTIENKIPRTAISPTLWQQISNIRNQVDSYPIKKNY